MINIYFDESRNTGEIGYKKDKLNYYQQRYFVLVGVIDTDDVIVRYKGFYDRNFLKVKTNSKKRKEIKGNDLLRKDNGLIFEEFLSEFIGKGKYLITIYDKKFFLVTQLILWLFGEPFREREYELFRRFCDVIHKVNDRFFIKYLNVTKHNNREEIIKFIEYALGYGYKECVGSPYESHIVSQWKEALQTFTNDLNTYVDLLLDENVENIHLQGKNRNNIVNLTALGETILTYKYINTDVRNEDIHIYHDEIELVQDYIAHYWPDKNLSFVSSNKEFGVQLADNIASIVGNLIGKLLPLADDKDLEKKIGTNNEWLRTQLGLIVNSHLDDIKIVMTMRDQAALLTYTDTAHSEVTGFKKDLQIRLNDRLDFEIRNNLDPISALQILKK